LKIFRAGSYLNSEIQGLEIDIQVSVMGSHPLAAMSFALITPPFAITVDRFLSNKSLKPAIFAPLRLRVRITDMLIFTRIPHNSSVIAIVTSAKSSTCTHSLTRYMWQCVSPHSNIALANASQSHPVANRRPHPLKSAAIQIMERISTRQGS